MHHLKLKKQTIKTNVIQLLNVKWEITSNLSYLTFKKLRHTIFFNALDNIKTTIDFLNCCFNDISIQDNKYHTLKTQYETNLNDLRIYLTNLAHFSFDTILFKYLITLYFYYHYWIAQQSNEK